MNVDEHIELAMDYDVSSVPVLVALKNGREVKRLVGLQDIEKLRSLVKNTKWLDKKKKIVCESSSGFV